MFTILTLNLHSYQEEKQAGDSAAERIAKHAPLFDHIATAILDLNVDVVCLQEVGEWRHESLTVPYGQAVSNAARQINARLRLANGRFYHIAQNWSHYAWDIWREGAAVLSKWPIHKSSSRYVTTSHDNRWWKSRNILMAQIDMDNIGLINLFSVHLGWWEDADEPFQSQFDTLAAWADEEANNEVVATFLCGDFNIVAGGVGYDYVVDNGRYIDQYLLANPNGMHHPTIGSQIDGWEKNQSNGQRIDYVFMKQGGHLTIQSAHIIFTNSSYGRVSDHAGVYTLFQ